MKSYSLKSIFSDSIKLMVRSDIESVVGSFNSARSRLVRLLAITNEEALHDSVNLIRYNHPLCFPRLHLPIEHSEKRRRVLPQVVEHILVTQLSAALP